MIPEIQDLRLRTGRPHWFVIDEAHHVLPKEWALTASAMPEEVSNLMLVTVHPGHVATVALRRMNAMLVVGREPKKLMNEFANAAGVRAPETPGADLARGQALFWTLEDGAVTPVQLEPSQSEHHRHRRKYAEGQLEPDQMFHFTGPDGKMDLHAQNLNIFVQLADGIDAETWLFHLGRGDYSSWIRRALRDTELAEEIEAVEKDKLLADRESRDRVKDSILARYTAPA